MSARSGGWAQRLGGNRQSGRPVSRSRNIVYADDLDLFGRGSLFELISTARTGAGESTLARWLLAPGERAEVVARQQAVEELRSRIGSARRAGADGRGYSRGGGCKGPGEWGERAPVNFFRGARVVAILLAAARRLRRSSLFLRARAVSWPRFCSSCWRRLGFNIAMRDRCGTVADGRGDAGA